MKTKTPFKVRYLFGRYVIEKDGVYFGIEEGDLSEFKELLDKIIADTVKRELDPQDPKLISRH